MTVPESIQRNNDVAGVGHGGKGVVRRFQKIKKNAEPHPMFGRFSKHRFGQKIVCEFIPSTCFFFLQTMARKRQHRRLDAAVISIHKLYRFCRREAQRVYIRVCAYIVENKLQKQKHFFSRQINLWTWKRREKKDCRLKIRYVHTIYIYIYIHVSR